MIKNNNKKTFKTGDAIADALDGATTDTDFFGANGPCPILVEPGNQRFIVITGENASGKSFFGRVIRAYLPKDPKDAKKEIEWIGLSMSKRTESGMIRGFIYGDEGMDSTGNISMRTIQTGFSTCRGRESRHILFLDEPDIPAHFC